MCNSIAIFPRVRRVVVCVGLLLSFLGCRTREQAPSKDLHETSAYLDTKSPEWCEKIKYRSVKSECAKNAYNSWLDSLVKKEKQSKTQTRYLEARQKCASFAKLIYAYEVQGSNYRRDEMEFRANCLDRISSEFSVEDGQVQYGLSH